VDIAPAVSVGLVIGLLLSEVASSVWLQFGFAIFVVVLAGLRLKVALAALADRSDAATDGTGRAAVASITLVAAGGVIHGLFGTGGPLIVYAVGRKLTDKSQFRATLAVLWLALNTALMVRYALSATFTIETTWLTLILVASLLPGAWLGERLHRTLDRRRFEVTVWGLLLVAGAVLAVRAGFSI
jgi:uncharacterized protein